MTAIRPETPHSFLVRAHSCFGSCGSSSAIPVQWIRNGRISCVVMIPVRFESLIWLVG